MPVAYLILSLFLISSSFDYFWSAFLCLVLLIDLGFYLCLILLSVCSFRDHCFGFTLILKLYLHRADDAIRRLLSVSISVRYSHKLVISTLLPLLDIDAVGQRPFLFLSPFISFLFHPSLSCGLAYRPTHLPLISLNSPPSRCLLLPVALTSFGRSHLHLSVSPVDCHGKYFVGERRERLLCKEKEKNKRSPSRYVNIGKERHTIRAAGSS